jgi:antirestriction protein
MERVFCFSRPCNVDEGEWMNLFEFSNKKEFLKACCDKLQCTENELKFSDWYGIPAQFECDDENISERLWELSKLDEDEVQAIEVYCERFGYDLKDKNTDIVEVIEKMRDSYSGQWDSKEDFAETMFNDLYLYEIPKHLKRYIDYQRFTNDISRCDYRYDDKYGCVFRLN